MIFRNLKLQRAFSLFTLLIFCNLITGCKYYLASAGNTNNNQATETIDKEGRYKSNYYVLHVGDALWEIDPIILKQNSLQGNLKMLDPEALRIFSDMSRSSTGRVKRFDKIYVNQVHIYADKFTKDGSNINIEEGDIKRVDVYENNTGKNIASVIGSSLLVAGGGLGILIALACASACPHIYVYDGNTYYFNNSIFTGAIAPQLERHDYKVMPDYFPDSESYNFYVINEKEENQFTNQLELIVIEHDKVIDVIADQQGKLYSISKKVEAISIMDDAGKDIKELAGFHDGRAFVYNSETENTFNHVYATFERPADVSNAKIVLETKNTAWSGYVYHEFTQLFGSKYNKYTTKNQKKSSREEMLANQKAHGILQIVEIKNEQGEWVELDVIEMVGSVSYNSIAIDLDEKYITTDRIELRLTSGFMFWKLDYVGMDFSSQRDFTVQYLSPSIATGDDGTDYVAELSSDDQAYMNHPTNGDSTYVEYSNLASPSDLKRTIILHSKGYYIPTTNYSGKIQRKELVKFKNDGELSRYSKRLYDADFEGVTVNFE
jgi:hypothetical protein